MQNWKNNDRMIKTIFILQSVQVRKDIDLIPGNRLSYEKIKVVSLLGGFFLCQKQNIKGGSNGTSKKAIGI